MKYLSIEYIMGRVWAAAVQPEQGSGFQVPPPTQSGWGRREEEEGGRSEGQEERDEK